MKDHISLHAVKAVKNALEQRNGNERSYHSSDLNSVEKLKSKNDINTQLLQQNWEKI